jgi:hypothetical protein
MGSAGVVSSTDLPDIGAIPTDDECPCGTSFSDPRHLVTHSNKVYLLHTTEPGGSSGDVPADAGTTATSGESATRGDPS